MKRFFVVIFLCVCFPCAAWAELPLEAFFVRAAGHFGIHRDDTRFVLDFSRSLKDDMLVNFSIASLYPPALEIEFASGKKIQADGLTLRLIEDTERTIYAETVCPVLLIVCGLLLWAGFFLVSLPLFVAGIECAILIAIICT